jgi:hypothetical protein
MNALQRLSLWVSLSTFALLPPLSARSDEVRLDDGRVLVGKVVQRGDTFEITTRDGVVVVPASRVVGRRSEAELRKALTERAREAGSTAFANLHVAMDAFEWGLDRDLWRYLDRVIKALDEDGGQDPANAVVTRRLDDFLASLEPVLLPSRWQNAPTERRVHELLDLLRADTMPGQAAAIETLLAREPNADQYLRTEARRQGSERRRLAAVGALQRREMAGNQQFVLRTAIVDRSSEVRAGAIDLARGRDDAAAVAYLAPGLMHPNPKVRVRTGEAFARLGHAGAIAQLVAAGPNAGAGLAGGTEGQRAHVAFLQQQAYIRDFDVEVAQAAFIADPQVDVLMSGTVLDVTVAGVYETVTIVRAWQKALKDLTKQDPGQDPRRWAAWYASLPQQTTPTTDAR